VEKSSSTKAVFVIEKRRLPRFKVELPLDYSRVVEKGAFQGAVADVNEGGILVYLPEEMQIGDLFRIKIFFTKEMKLNTIQAMAKVVWADAAAKKSCGEYRYGLQLVSFYKGDMNKFKLLLKEVQETHESRRHG
jgi:hypothetical protein